MDALSLRPVTSSDREFLLRVYASTRAQELAPVPWSDEQKSAFVAMQFDAQDTWWREQKPTADFAVIVLGTEPVGRLYVDRLAREIRVVDIALLPEHRGRGIGNALLADILAEGDRTGRPVTIHVEHGNPARALYDRLGFEHISDTGVHSLLQRSPRVPMEIA